MEELEASSEELPAEKVEAKHLVVRLKLSRTKLCNHKCSVLRIQTEPIVDRKRESLIYPTKGAQTCEYRLTGHRSRNGTAKQVESRREQWTKLRSRQSIC